MGASKFNNGGGGRVSTTVFVKFEFAISPFFWVSASFLLPFLDPVIIISNIMSLVKQNSTSDCFYYSKCSIQFFCVLTTMVPGLETVLKQLSAIVFGKQECRDMYIYLRPKAS